MVVCLVEVNSRLEADLFVGLLRSHGIHARTSADDAVGTDPLYQFAFGVRVLVPSTCEADARRLLEAADA